jgi:hypothetical protein
LQGAQNYTSNFFDTAGKANQVGADYAPPGMTPEGMVGKPDMNEYLQGLMKFGTVPQMAEIGQSMTKETEPNFYQKELFKAGLKPQEPSFYEKEDWSWWY